MTPLTIQRRNFDTEIDNNLKEKIKEQKMKNAVLTIAVMVTLGVTGLMAQPVKFNDNHVKTLCQGITSENLGLRRSAIYQAGKYAVNGTCESLLTQLKVEDDPSTKVLIALALYKIGDEEGMEAVEFLAKNDSDKEVRRMSTAILQQVELERRFDTASIK
jgi:HEAT repeat protein